MTTVAPSEQPPTRELPARTVPRSDLNTVYNVLKDQRAHTFDIVTPVGDLEFEGGNLVISGREAKVTDSGVYDINGLYAPVPSVDNQLDTVLDIPAKYIRKLRAENLGLLDVNLNTLAGMAAAKNPNQKQLVRMLWGESPDLPGSTGIVRAILSNGYRIQDNLDTLMAVLQGLQTAGLDYSAIKRVDLSNDKLYLYVVAPKISVTATALLDGYRAPDGTTSRQVGDIVSAGMIVKNGEIGNSGFSVTPVIEVLACTNGMVQTVDVVSRRHVGGRLDEGVIDWSDDTRIKVNASIAAQVRDLTAQFLNKDYVEAAIARMEVDAGFELSKPAETIEVVAKALSYTVDEQEAILGAFIKGGQLTSGGVMQAVTAYAQTVEDIDRSYDLGATGVRAMEVARRHAESLV